MAGNIYRKTALDKLSSPERREGDPREQRL